MLIVRAFIGNFIPTIHGSFIKLCPLLFMNVGCLEENTVFGYLLRVKALSSLGGSGNYSTLLLLVSDKK